MKYLKTYEAHLNLTGNNSSLYTDNKDIFIEYWKIPTNDPKLTIALNKIDGCDLKRSDFFKSNVKYKNDSKFGNRKYVYIIKLIEIMDRGIMTINWHWNNGIEIIKTYNNKFMGNIKVSKEEVKEYKIRQEMKKFNL